MSLSLTSAPRVNRGGCWIYPEWYACVNSRSTDDSSAGGDGLGLRLLRRTL